MARRMARVRMAACAAALLAAVGCSRPGTSYLARRGADLGDCVRAEAGLGWPLAPLLFDGAGGQGMTLGGQRGWKPGLRYWLLPRLYFRAKATDFVVVGDGFAQPVRYGVRGRYSPSGKAIALAAGFPLLSNHEEGSGLTVHTVGPCVTTRTYDGPEPGPGGRVAERCWTGVSATLVVSLALDLNLVELADFLVGWSGWDLLRDDDWRATEL